jgi:hypothetical protein
MSFCTSNSCSKSGGWGDRYLRLTMYEKASGQHQPRCLPQPLTQVPSIGDIKSLGLGFHVPPLPQRLISCTLTALRPWLSFVLPLPLLPCVAWLSCLPCRTWCNIIITAPPFRRQHKFILSISCIPRILNPFNSIHPIQCKQSKRKRMQMTEQKV